MIAKANIDENSLKKWCEQNCRMDLLLEWDSEKNAPLSPDTIARGSHKKVWWKCKNNHLWDAEVKSRTNGYGCPYCAGIKVLSGYNDLATVDSNLAKEWNYEKNSPLTPSEVTAWSHKKVWWKCKNEHIWESTIAHRSRGSSCPYCSGRIVISGVTDLMTINPELAEEWDYEKNHHLTPENVTTGSHYKIWWKCKNGHSWATAVSQRTRGRGCPYCSNKKVLVGYNDFATTHPDMAKEWDYDKNGDLKPTDITYSSSKKVWWKCKFSHEWQATLNSRTQGHGCPDCARAGSSMPEQGLFYYLSKVTKVEQRIKLFSKEIDIYLPVYSIGVEYDGIYWHKEKTKADIEKETILIKNGITLFRLIESDKDMIVGNKISFVYSDSYVNYNDALKKLCNLLAETTGNNDFNKLEINYLKDRALIREQFDLYEKDNSFAIRFPDLAKEWNYEKNGRFTPGMFYPSASDKVWWICQNRHEWKATIASRSRGSTCPYCVYNSFGKKVLCVETGVVYNSCNEATRQTGIVHISSCCTGKRKTAGGYHWKYIN